MTTSVSTYTVFQGYQRLASGTLPEVTPVYKDALKATTADAVLIFDDQTGRSIDIDLRHSDRSLPIHNSLSVNDGAAVAVQSEAAHEPHKPLSRGRGRPKLGVIAREVTLLPRHWEWLAAQPGGASVALRKLVESARLGSANRDARRHAQERAYHFMLALGGDLPGYEEATRALFAGDLTALEQHIAGWPDDVRLHALKLAATA